MNNTYYEALMEGRYPIHIETRLSEAGDTWIASFSDVRGHEFEVEDSSQAAAHRACTNQVMEAIRLGEVVPEL